jgi:hypothetical protein
MKVGELKDMLQALDEQTADLQKMQGLQLWRTEPATHWKSLK